MAPRSSMIVRGRKTRQKIERDANEEEFDGFET
jgi:hypothetical protein